MKKIIIISLFMIFIIPVFAVKLDLNTASLEELKILLPITEQQADDIYNYRFYISFFESIYQLREIESIDQETLNSLKPLVSVTHYDEKDESAQRRDDIYYLIERLGSNEGLQEGMSDIWEDYLISPRNINKLAFSDILNLPNTSPLDVAAILNRVSVGDSISSYRDLRKSPGISYYGAKNLQNYVYYKEQPEVRDIYFDYQMKYNDSPYEDSEKEMYKESMIRFADGSPAVKNKTYWGYFNMDSHRASIMNKLRMRVTSSSCSNEWKAGYITNSEKMSNTFFLDQDDEYANDAKFYLGYESEINLIGNNFIKIYTGNYRATFGEGLVMENTDSYSISNP